MDKHKQPGIKIRSIYQSECIFQRLPAKKNGPLNNNLQFKYGYKLIDEDRGVAELTLISDGNLKESSESIYHSEITYIGIFELEKGLENMSLEVFLKNNAPAFLIPYLRESLSAMCLKSGLPEVYLPPLNILAMLEQGDKETNN